MDWIILVQNGILYQSSPSILNKLSLKTGKKEHTVKKKTKHGQNSMPKFVKKYTSYKANEKKNVCKLQPFW